MASPTLFQTPHRRFNPLTEEWVLVSPHRTARPWQGQQEKSEREQRPEYDPTCYLCPGNDRAGGSKNPPYTSTFVFRNDYSALLPDGLEETQGELLRAEGIRGECRVICFSPRHDLSLAEMEVRDIAHVVDVWAEQIEDLGRSYKWVQIFENKGQVMGCSNPHPHGQVWASNFLPTLPAKEEDAQRRYYEKNGRALLQDTLAEELKDGRRIIEQNDHWVTLIPFWATWPFETLLLPRRHVTRLPDLEPAERAALASIMKDGLSRYDRLFDTSFPYSMGWHGAPTDGEEHPHWVLHAHYFPPLLRSASVKKFMVGYEMLAEAQRDLTPETAADRLREV